MNTHTQQRPMETWVPDSVEGQLAIDVFETDDNILIQSAIAGVDPEVLDIFINPDMVTIRGTRERDARANDATVHYEECFWGSFSRTIMLPCHVQSDRSEAKLKNGVLTITLPKQTNVGARVSVKKV
ncbi:Hsp20/alpha crystallin family protein [Candidatus Uhrbacteria bacterium]|nr:Hsp20/alpha crystallin family protein [Candidatus Uhrbacteria bacterium]